MVLVPVLSGWYARTIPEFPLLAVFLVLALFATLAMYWFRYTCALILSNRTAKDYAQAVAEANGLSFPEASALLRAGNRATLDELHATLQRDYEFLCCLLRHSTSYGIARNRYQQVILRADYLMLSTVFPIIRAGSADLAGEALLEMAGVVSYLAHSMGERSAILARA